MTQTWQPPSGAGTDNGGMAALLKTSASFVLALLTAVTLGAACASAKALDAPRPEPWTSRTRTIDYSELLNTIDANEVASARISGNSARVEIQLALRDGQKVTSSYLPSDTIVQQHLLAHHVPVAVAASTAGTPIWLVLAPVVFVVVGLGAIVSFLLRGGAVRSSRRRGKSPGLVRTYTSTVLFDDVAGCAEAVEEVREIVDFLREPERFRRLGVRFPSSILLYGPPGTGKTLIAKALAGESGVPFFAVSASEFTEMFVGVGAKRIRDLFAHARRCKDGAVVFFDEIEAIGRHRSSAPTTGGNEEREQTLNQLLVELDGFDTSSNVVVVAATNRIDLLDPALLRPGRFGRHIPVNLPSRMGRETILELHANGVPLAGDVDFPMLAESTAGLSGADLAEIVNEAAILAARAAQADVNQRNLQDAVLRVLLGPEKRNAALAEGELEVIAHHEAGHALAAELCPNHDKPLRATVRPRGEAAGFVFMGRADRALHDTDLIHEKMVVALAGRAAEQIAFGKVSSGAANDLEQVSAIARQAVEKLGLSPEVGQIVSFDDRSQLSEEALSRVDRVVEQLVHAAYEDALGLISENLDSLRRLAELLISQTDLERVDILSAISNTAPAVRLRSRLGTRAGKIVQAAPRAERKAGVSRARNGRGFRLRQRLLPGDAVAAAAASAPQR